MRRKTAILFRRKPRAETVVVFVSTVVVHLLLSPAAKVEHSEHASRSVPACPVPQVQVRAGMGKSQSKDEVKEVEGGEQSRKKDFVSTYCKAMR